ncbi:MAG: hypothetical protein IJX90_06305 [Blautia sp.]|nr:hypothetical protein [Blautia sp.]
MKYRQFYEPSARTVQRKWHLVTASAVIACLSVFLPWISLDPLLADTIEDVVPLGILNLSGMYTGVYHIPKVSGTVIPVCILITVMFLLNLLVVVRGILRRESHRQLFAVLAAVFDLLSWLGIRILCRLLNPQLRNLLGEELSDYMDSSSVNMQLTTAGIGAWVALLSALAIGILIYRIRNDEEAQQPTWIMDKRK